MPVMLLLMLWGLKAMIKGARRGAWALGKYYTFKGAWRVWRSFVEAKLYSDGKRVRGFDTLADAERFLRAS